MYTYTNSFHNRRIKSTLTLEDIENAYMYRFYAIGDPGADKLNRRLLAIERNLCPSKSCTCRTIEEYYS